MKKTTIPLIILLIVTLIGGLMLVKQNQDTRKGASFANTKLMLLPSEKIIKRMGEIVPVKVHYLTESGAKVDGVQVVVCFGDELILDPDTGVMVNTENGFESDPIVSVSDNCATLVATSKKEADKLKTTGEVFALNFLAMSEGEGFLTITQTKSMVTGDNTASATDKEIAITSVENTTYQIIGEATLCSVDADCESGEYCYQPPKPACPVGEDCTADLMPPKYCKTIECNLSLNPPINCPSGYNCVTDALNGTNGTCVSGGTGEAPILNYKVSFGYVGADDDKCVVSWPMEIMVLANGESKTYKDVKAIKIGEANGLAAYVGSLQLAGFNSTENVAAFIKGPKHLQMKYAVQNQSATYGKAPGELTLTKSQATSPMYNFSSYPMIAGDVIGVDSDEPDNWINGLDFSYVKTRALKHETVSAGSYLKADLDGNCQVNSRDVMILKISLETKQGQLY